MLVELVTQFKMEEEEEDRVLLNALGVTSANPEDIERDIIEKVVFLYYMLFPCLDLLNFFSNMRK